MEKKSLFILVSVSVLALAGCAGGGGDPVSVCTGPCSGGGSGGGGGTPDTVHTTEYYAAGYLDQISADDAYAKGYTGKGVNIAVIDGGITDTSPELSGVVLDHIDTTADNPSGTPAFAPDREHGTAIAGLIAAAKNDSLTHGVAYESKLYDLNIYPDLGTANGNDLHQAFQIILGNDPAHPTVQSAKVVNMSFAGSNPYSGTEVQDMRDLVSAGKILVMAAGNSSGSDPVVSSQVVADAGIAAQALVVGAVDGANNIASFSNQAGSFAQYYVVAPGVNLKTIDNSGNQVNFSGTSAATPVVTAVAAIIMQAYPSLTPAQVVDLIKTTTIDLGAPGVDSVYGNGLVDLAGAMAPVGPASVPSTANVNGASVPVAASTYTMGSAMGMPSGGKVIMLDSFQRAFELDLAKMGGHAHSDAMKNISSFSGRAAAGGVGDVLDTPFKRGQQRFEFSDNGNSAAVTAAMAFSDNWVGVATANGPATALVAMKGLEPATQSGQTLFLATEGAAMPQGQFFSEGATGYSFGYREGNLRGSVGLASEVATNGRYDPLAEANYASRSHRNSMIQGSLAYNIDNVQLGIAAGVVNEPDSALGGQGQGLFQNGNAKTSFTTASFATDLGHGYSASATYTRAMLVGGEFANGMRFNTVNADAFSATVSGKNGLTEGDTFGFRVSQPLRVTSGSFNAYLPVSREVDGTVNFASQRVDVSAPAREMDFEAAYAVPLSGFDMFRSADLRFNAVYATNPGNVSGGPAAGAGVAIRFTW